MASSSTQHPRQTVVVQATIRKPLHAESHFNKKTKDGSIPLVLVPTYPHFCDTFVRIPSGVWVLYQRWNAHAGMLEPGLIPVWAAYNRVSHIVTKHAVAYSAPVERCPTSDNVMVDIDISINFQIGPSADDAVKFVYMLGAQRFNELISMLTAEGIRGLVHSVRHDQVHDLREEFASGMKRDLNHKLVAYGVVIHNVKVTNVALPTRLSATLEKTTAFKTKMEEQEKKHENDMRILLNDETKLLTAIQKANDRNVKDLVAQKERELISRHKLILGSESTMEVMCIHETAKYNALVLQTAGKRDIAFATATAAATMKRNDAMMLLVAAQREYEQRVNAEQIKQQAMLDVASKTAAGLLAAADAEAKSADALAVKRQFEYAFRKNQVDQQLVGRAKMVISGDNGEALIRRLVDV
ncbi:hypothetical protein DYB37_000978 [Aphanomyces astaci]|uniref:Band 7 domain-containing protein n=1 Tax=Aphanomyces astaci TaxID=112090 RepID=A0A397BF56_APHAT|nr:hypothetical protein DYB36_008009 [Aphanomyces astaci]RHY19297.1 hypothetical protein DYB25_006714 [Aphanomyces astaci]RHY55041.1 hypothetical protein DYB38_007551 [Aphanomyces astaci]RHY57629.1 hypothetical protein DYB30_006405 [Aphanomyces astaci]RHY67590.1 hypothetical protein DYB34_007584 [Aphanomyces astaci]